jgi:hypothetical protein
MADCLGSICRYRDVGWIGNAVALVRENGGNTTADFKLDASNALIKADDSTPLATWLSNNAATIAFMHTGYDQSGDGNHIVMATTTKQPQIHVTGVNGHAALKFDGTDDFLDWASDWLSLNFAEFYVSGVPGHLDGDRRVFGCGATNVLRFGTSATGAGVYVGRFHTTSVEGEAVTPWARVWHARHTGNVAQLFIDKNSIGNFGTITQTGAILDINLGADINGTANFWSGYICEWGGSTTPSDDATRLSIITDLAGVVGARVMNFTDIRTDATAGDSLHDADIFGTGLPAFLHALENGRVYGIRQTAPLVFDEWTIRGTTVSGSPKVEGCCWVLINGVWHAVVFDQQLDEVRIYKPDSTNYFTATWTEGVIASGLPNLQRGSVHTIGGVEVIVAAYEGDTASDGGIIFLQYDGSGDTADPANWTVRAPIVHPGTWAFVVEDVDEDGRPRVFFTARHPVGGHNTNNVPGLYNIKAPASDPLTTTWPEFTIDATVADFLNLALGDLFGNGNRDILCNLLAPTAGLRRYDVTAGYESPITASTLSEGGGGSLWNCGFTGFARNGRDSHFSISDSRIAIHSYTGTAWTVECRLVGAIGKADNYVALLGGKLFMADSLGLTVTYVDFAPPADGALVVPAITSNGGGATAAIEVEEGETAVTTVVATGSATITYSKFGDDASAFNIDSSTGVLTFASPPDFDVPTDADADNVYEVTVVATNAGSSDSQALSVEVTAAGVAPTITSNGGGATANINAAENQTAVTTVVATGDATIVYSKSGTDAALFDIDSSTGVLTFDSAPDYETPTDANTDNVYLVTVTATNDTGADSQDLSITVTNVAEGGGADPHIWPDHGWFAHDSASLW